MTTPQELITLAERVERATADQQRELLSEAFYTINGDPMDAHVMDAAPQAEWMKRESRMFTLLRSDAYESSAMTLLPEGWHIQFLCQDRYTQKTMVALGRNGDNSGLCAGSEDAATPALALTAACLRAHAANLERGQ